MWNMPGSNTTPSCVGQGDKFEIWDQARFKALLSQDFDDVADELAESGIDFSF